MTRFTSSRLHVSMKIPRSELIPGQQVREIVQFPRHHVYDLALTLDVSFGLQQCGMPRGQTVFVVDVGADDEVDDAGFVFEGFEKDSGGGAEAVADQHPA